jgi:hypothetical protein
MNLLCFLWAPSDRAAIWVAYASSRNAIQEPVPLRVPADGYRTFLPTHC